MSDVGGTTRGRRRDAQRGQSLAELALMLPVLLILLFGVVEFGMVLKSYIQVTNATREGARYAALGATAGSFPTNCQASGDTTVVGRTCGSLAGLKLANVSSVSVTYPDGKVSGNKVVVTVNYTYKFFTPVGGLISLFSGGSSGNQITLTSSTTMRLE